MVKFPSFSPNLLIGVLGLGAIFLILRQGSQIGKDIASFGKDFKPFEGFKFPSITFPSLPLLFPPTEDEDVIIPSDPFDQTKAQQEELFGRTLTDEEKQNIKDVEEALARGDVPPVTTPDSPFLREFNPPGIFGFGILGTGGKGITTQLAQQLGIFDLRTTDLSQQQISQLGLIGQGITSIETIFDLFPRREDIIFARAFGLDIPPRDQPITVEEPLMDPTIPEIPAEEIDQFVVVSQLPSDQEFGFGGTGFIGGTIRENPIDTLSEVLANFPGITASQAADFLAATGGTVLPSQVQAGLIDPDIRNIVAGFIGGGRDQMFPVSQTPGEIDLIREEENRKAAEFTCREFGLNCELV